MTTTKLPILVPILNSIPSVNHFKEIIENNKGTVIIKFGANWCGPCKRIDAQVHNWFNYFSTHCPLVQTYLIDVDDNLEVYGFLKNKKMVNGIPAILVYKKQNITHIPDATVLGANPQEIDLLFKQYI